jgi:hypothetical protein
MSPALQENWDVAKAFLTRIRSNGVKARSDVLESLQSAFSWMTPPLALEAYQHFAVLSGFSPSGECRFGPLTAEQRGAIVSRGVVGGEVIYRPFPLGPGAPEFLVSEQRRLSGVRGKVVSVRSEVYNVEMPGEEVVSAVGDELEFIESARPISNDPMRETVREFLSNVPSLTKVPASQMGIMKEVLEPSHVVYMHTETLPNGKPYTVEFHMVPGELDADVYVVRDYDNHPLEEAGFSIEDVSDWNLSEVDHVDALFSKEMARTGVKEEQVAGDEHIEPSLDGKQYTFDNWWNDVESVNAGLRRPSLLSTVVSSGVLRRITSGGSAEDWYKIAELARELQVGIQETRDALARIWGWDTEEGLEGSGDDLSGDDSGPESIPSGAQAFLNRALDFGDKLVNRPLSVVDEVAELPARAADAIVKKKQLSRE